MHNVFQGINSANVNTGTGGTWPGLVKPVVRTHFQWQSTSTYVLVAQVEKFGSLVSARRSQDGASFKRLQDGASRERLQDGASRERVQDKASREAAPETRRVRRSS